MKFKIFQLKSIRDTDYAFGDWECAEEHGFSLNDYKEVYSGSREKKYILNNLYEEFNINHPTDFKGHSMSVSDVVALKSDNGNYWYWYYCDSFGWKEITAMVNLENGKE